MIAKTAAFLAAAVLAIPTNSFAAEALQGQSRTVSMADICGKTCDAIEKFSQCGREGELLEGPTFDDKNNLYVVSLRGGHIYKITPDGACREFANTGGEPQGLKFHDGHLYGVDLHRGVFMVDLATGAVSDYLKTYYNQNFKGPNDLIFDETGGLYFTDPWGTSLLNPAGAIYYIAPGPDKKITKLADNLAFPNGIALSPDSKTLYVSEFGNQRVISIPIAAPGILDAGFAHVMAHLSGGVGPDSMAVDANGNIYVAHFGAGEIDVFDPQGFVVGFIPVAPKGGWLTTNVAFHGGYLYITEASQRIVWRLKVNVAGAHLN